MSTLAPVSSVSRKRKRDEEKVLLGDPLVIHPHLSSVFDTSLKISPAVLFPRKQVPFNWLSGAPSRLFSAHIPALDASGNILITKTDGERQLSAVERVSEGVFSLFKLSPSVKMKDVRRLAQQARKTVSQAPECKGGCGQDILKKDWWVDLALSNFSVGLRGSESQTVVLSMIHPSKIKQNLKAKLSLEPTNSWLISPPAEASVSRDRNPVETLEQIGSQYLEALYIAKTSIAYFAKSTLSRARVKFQQETPEASTPAPAVNQLVNFLQSMVIPLDKMDSKYKNVIMQVVMEEAIEDNAIFRVGEESYVRRWLSMNFRNEVLRSNDPALKLRVEDLKIRETELQIILLLEILALMKDGTPSGPEVNTQKKKKIKKSSRGKKASVAEPPEPTVLLDLLLDRLCIWRSIGPLAAIDRPKNSNIRDAEEDRLRDFCVEVVMPFYSSRLPEICATIQKKIGNTTPLPGSATTPLIGLKRRKTSSLSRSKTAPVTTLSSRNATPSDLLNLPKSNSKPVDLGAVAKKTLQKREVQMPTLNLKAAVNVDEELKDAIKAVAKPNRVAAGVEMMDAITKRFSASRKTKKPLRNPNLNNILVHATPSKKSHSRQIIPANEISLQGEEEDEDSFLPPPRPPTPHDTRPAIFASPVKRSYRPPNLPQAAYHIHASLASTEVVPESSPGHVLNTPVKGGNKIGKKVGLSFGAGNIDEDIVPGSSPIKPTRSRSCGLLHWKPKSLMVDSSPVQVSTPLKRGKIISSHDYDYEDTDGELDNTTPKLQKSTTLGSTLDVASAKLDFSMISRVPDSAGNKLGISNGSLRARTSSRKSSRCHADFGAEIESGEEISIYKSLGWEDEDPLF